MRFQSPEAALTLDHVECEGTRFGFVGPDGKPNRLNIIEGPSGVGKTRILLAVRDEAARLGIPCCWVGLRYFYFYDFTQPTSAMWAEEFRIAVQAAASNGIIILEHPTAFIPPLAHQAFIYELLRFQPNAQFFIETHSDDVFSMATSHERCAMIDKTDPHAFLRPVAVTT